jgi:peptide chain release factor 1
MRQAFLELEKRSEELGRQLASPEVLANRSEYARLAREHARLEEAAAAVHRLRALEDQIQQAEELAKSDTELADLARAELADLRAQAASVEQRLMEHLLPRDPNEGKNVILEIRAGTGGDEAALFAGDLFRMYARYAERQGWKLEVLSSNPIGVGGFKHVVAGIEGADAWRHLCHESGVHRVQRVPVTEAGGRIHTSTATVAVLAEPDPVEVRIDDKDIKMQTYRASGAGGQNVQKVESAVRITHIPTGITVTCEDERSQYQNKIKALRVLRAHIMERLTSEQAQEIAQARRSQVGTAERSEKIRTYNFPQDRITDHRLGRNFHNLPEILDGHVGSIIEALEENARARQMEELARA